MTCSGNLDFYILRRPLLPKIFHDASPMNIQRRTFLSTSTAAMALPWLESYHGFLHAADAKTPAPRLLLIALPLGIYKGALTPEQTGKYYKAKEYLELLGKFRDKTTIISGLDHPGVNGGHGSEPRIFTGVPSHKRNSIFGLSHIAAHIGKDTRYDCLALSSGRNEFSWTSSGDQSPGTVENVRGL